MKQALLSTILSVLCTYLFCFTAGQCQAASSVSDTNTSKVKSAATDPNAAKKIDETNFLAEKKYVTAKEKASDYDLSLQRHSIELGAETYNFRYEEPGDIEDKGDFYGGSISYIYRWWVPASKTEPLLKNNMGSFRGEFRYDSGEADYDGHLSNGTPYKIDDIEYNTFDTRLLIGLDALNKNWLASISTGVGYRYSNDDSSFDPNGYERESNYLYFPLAYQIDGKFVNNWAIGCKLEADLVAWGEQKSHLSDVGLTDITNRQTKGWGLRASVRLQNRTPIGTFIVEPFVRYWDIERSQDEIVGIYKYWEPDNQTTELGVQLVWKF